MVAPYTGAWIEIRLPAPAVALRVVAPYTGAWIEIGIEEIKAALASSLPTRERGLK